MTVPTASTGTAPLPGAPLAATPRRRSPGQRAVVTVGIVLAVAAVAITATGFLGTLLQQRQNQRATYSQGIHDLDIGLGSGDATVVVENRHDVLVERRLTWSFTRPDIQETVSGSTLRIRTGCPWFGSCEASYTVHVPAGTTVRAHTGSGDVLARGVASVTADSGSGNVEVTDVAGDVTAATGSGNIRASGVRAGKVTLRTGSGDVRVVSSAVAALTASSGSGNIVVGLDSSPERTDLRTGSGDVRATLPDDGAAYNVSVHTGSGTRDVTVRTDPGSARTISARTGSGNVSLHYSGG